VSAPPAGHKEGSWAGTAGGAEQARANRSAAGALSGMLAPYPLVSPALALSAVVILGTPTASAAGDPGKGEAVFVRQCALCHTIGRGEPNGFGPNLFGITERKAATAPGYVYSPEFTTLATWTWSPDGIASFVVAPALTIPGNKMGVFQGIADADADDLTAYLATQK
jgi:cytochrome c